MAKINFGQTVNDARGKLGGTVFSKNRSGAFTRRKVTPVNRNTAAQSAARTALGTLSQAWSGSLTDPQRQAWIAYAGSYPRLDIFGASINLSGLNMYVSLNAALAKIGVAANPLPPASNVVVPVPIDGILVAIAAPGALTFNVTADITPAPGKLYVFASAPLPPGRQPQQSDYRFLTDQAPAAGPYPASQSVYAAYVNKYGTLQTGKRIALLVATIDPTTGLTTVGLGINTIVVPTP